MMQLIRLKILHKKKTKPKIQPDIKGEEQKQIISFENLLKFVVKKKRLNSNMNLKKM